MTEDWLDFIISCRHGQPHEHDIVIGAMANDQIYAYNSFVSEKIDDYNSSFYYEAPQNILNAYIYGVIE